MSSLTGEPAAISRAVLCKDKEDREVDASNLVFSTGQIMEGEVGDFSGTRKRWLEISFPPPQTHTLTHTHIEY